MKRLGPDLDGIRPSLLLGSWYQQYSRFAIELADRMGLEKNRWVNELWLVGGCKPCCWQLALVFEHLLAHLAHS